jgi:hypothetical protein
MNSQLNFGGIGQKNFFVLKVLRHQKLAEAARIDFYHFKQQLLNSEQVYRAETIIIRTFWKWGC